MNVAIYFILLLGGVGFADTIAAEDACAPSEVMKFAELYTNPHVRPCQEVSAGFSIAPPRGYPTEPQVKAMCAAEACRMLIKDVLALKPNDCFLSFAGAKLNAFKLATRFEKACNPEKPSEDKDNSRSADKDGDESEGNNPTPKPKNYHMPVETKTVKGDSCCFSSPPKEADAKDADSLKPPMNGTAEDFRPMPNTTYKAEVTNSSLLL